MSLLSINFFQRLVTSWAEDSTPPLNNPAPVLAPSQPTDLESLSRAPSIPQVFAIEIPGQVPALVRGDQYEDPLAELLIEEDVGYVISGGTTLQRSGEGVRITGYDIQIRATNLIRAFEVVHTFMVKADCPQGTKIRFHDRSFVIGETAK